MVDVYVRTWVYLYERNSKRDKMYPYRPLGNIMVNANKVFEKKVNKK